MYSGHYPRIFVAPKNAQSAETKHWSGAVQILLLVIPASTTSAYSSLNVLQSSNPRLRLLKVLVYHSATSAVQFLVLGVHKEMSHFHEMSRGFVQDSMDHVGGVLLLSCMASHDRSACWFAIIVDAGQQGLLSYCVDLGLTVGVACWTIHQVNLVIQYSQVGNLLRLTKFYEWGGCYMGHDLACDWCCRCGDY